jgi:hypothetical protein
MIIYEASGGMRLVGCATVDAAAVYLVRFAVGSKAYVRKKAFRGVLDPVVIKKMNRVELNRPFVHGVGAVVNYVDTFNRVWIEEELVSQETAVDLAIIHWENIKQQGVQILQENGCLPMPPEGCRSSS